MDVAMDSALPVNPELLSLLEQAWQSFGQPGTCWTGAERLAIARQARAAREAAVSRDAEPGATRAGSHPATEELPGAVVDAVHRIVTDPGGLSERWARDLFDAGVSPEQLVEATSVVALLTIGDTLSRAAGMPVAELPDSAPGPAAATAGTDSALERPAGLESGWAWVDVVHPERAEGPVLELYDSFRRTAGFVYNIGRALTLVPSAANDFWRTFTPIYNTSDVPTEDEISRPQLELVASTVSAANECFY